VRSIALAAVLVAATTLAACKKTGENEFEVERPTVGTTTDTVRTPDVDVRMDTAKVTVPNVDVNVRKDTATVAVPKVDVKRP
jgi:hypothetical protein